MLSTESIKKSSITVYLFLLSPIMIIKQYDCVLYLFCIQWKRSLRLAVIALLLYLGSTQAKCILSFLGLLARVLAQSLKFLCVEARDPSESPKDTTQRAGVLPNFERGLLDPQR